MLALETHPLAWDRRPDLPVQESLAVGGRNSRQLQRTSYPDMLFQAREPQTKEVVTSDRILFQLSSVVILIPIENRPRFQTGPFAVQFKTLHANLVNPIRPEMSVFGIKAAR